MKSIECYRREFEQFVADVKSQKHKSCGIPPSQYIQRLWPELFQEPAGVAANNSPDHETFKASIVRLHAECKVLEQQARERLDTLFNLSEGTSQ